MTSIQSPANFKGNKSNLPHKLCVLCGRSMVWRKAWANNWDAVKYCSTHCSRAAKSKR
ncbi:DUF2256 domain-containing protein [Methylotenera sp. 1P/1]|uniref:DUF2256 domain-containing protein n=1 Tax=Methylotenera sp. 1P/1 TaxID=1131551 RepID=UPI0009DA217C